MFSDCFIHQNFKYPLQNQIWWSKLSNCSQVFYEKAALMNFVGKNLCRSLSFNKVSRLRKYFPVSFAQYFETLFLLNTSGWLLLLNTLFSSLRWPHPQKMCPSTLVILNILETLWTACQRFIVVLLAKQGDFKKVTHTVGNSQYLGYGWESFNV